MKESMPSVYSFNEVEDKWYKYWLEKDYFHADVDKKQKTLFHSVAPS